MLALALAPEGEHERCRKLGISAYLAKPIQPSQLLDAILNALSLHASEPSKVEDNKQEVLQQSDWRQGMKVLLAEGNAANRTLATRLLQKHGHTVVVVENGPRPPEQLKVARKAPVSFFPCGLCSVGIW